MIAGAAITRYLGWEGTIHIRDGESSSSCLSADKFISYNIKDQSGKVVESSSVRYNLTAKSAENFKRKVTIGDNKYELVLARIIRNASQSITESPDGQPIVSFHLSGNAMQRDNLIIKKGESKSLFGISFGFSAAEETDVKIFADSGSFAITSKYEIGRMSMMSQETSVTDPGNRLILKPMQVLTINGIKIVPQQMSMAGTIKAVAIDPSMQDTGQNAFIFHVFGKKSGTIFLWDLGAETPASDKCQVDGNTFEVSYGSKIITLPFSISLNNFEMERYPGSSSPSGYKSDVTLVDKANNIEKPFTIFMNNILKYKGYRFFQSSFDKDEKGTILSVNHDLAGMMVTYTGYALLFLFIILSLIIKNSQFRNIKASAWSSALRKGAGILILLIISSGLTTLQAQKFVPGKQSADEFGRVLVQDQKGRTKPLFTLSNDILRKVSRTSNFDGNTPMQVFLGLYFDFDHWKDVPVIKVSNKDIQKEIGITGDMAAFSDLVELKDAGGTYKLSEIVNKAYAKPAAERNKFDKEVMKVDERVNIIYMIYKGDFMRIFPLRDNTKKWGTPDEAIKLAAAREDSSYLKNAMPLLIEALQNNNEVNAKQISESICGYQVKYAGYVLPSSVKTRAEVAYYKLGIFEKLFPFYSTIGLIMLVGLIIMIIRGKKQTSLFVKILGWILIAGFLFHTLGFGLRWYIAGHSPMTNGYESLIFISWVALLAGLIFSRKSAFALPATSVLAGLALMVAHLSFMDPEITNLVPVLKSYWLTLHVSVITGSYGFLGFGAILGLISMILMLLSNQGNQQRISATIDELAVLNFKTLTLGLYFLTIGTFLGAVWANESWGRYWGWDPKETWSLITIIVYTFVTHSRMIPGLKSIYTFNLLSLAGFSSVLMTYFGVNYYLSGMHSYASGDPVPVPSFVYIAVLLLAGLALAAYLKYRKLERQNLKD
jgi:cytochrome c-type biogenesis protein CcsB